MLTCPGIQREWNASGAGERVDSSLWLSLNQGMVMSIRSLAKNLPADPNNKGHVLGWGMCRNATWDFVDIYASKDAADAETARLGEGYSVDFGSHELGTDNYLGGLTPPGAPGKQRGTKG